MAMCRVAVANTRIAIETSSCGDRFASFAIAINCVYASGVNSTQFSGNLLSCFLGIIPFRLWCEYVVTTMWGICQAKLFASKSWGGKIRAGFYLVM